MQPPDMEGILQELNPPPEAKLAHGVGLVNLDSFDAEVQPIRYLLVAMAPGNKAQHLTLAFAGLTLWRGASAAGLFNKTIDDSVG